MDTKVMSQFEVMDEDMLTAIEGGWGYVWRCSDGYVSAKHVFRFTAQENADNHVALYGGVCRVYNV
ncbi:bacteriocin [Streptococcus cristatus]|uniref:bacteriocin n=1 Tax=Streptococcus cristatus TaxID=45634 RepID=UPI0039C2DD9B